MASCAICEGYFLNDHNLQQHLAGHAHRSTGKKHRIRKGESSKPVQYHCFACSVDLADETRKTVHLLDHKHIAKAEETGYSCKACGVSFLSGMRTTNLMDI